MMFTSDYDSVNCLVSVNIVINGYITGITGLWLEHSEAFDCEKSVTLWKCRELLEWIIAQSVIHTVHLRYIFTQNYK